MIEELPSPNRNPNVPNQREMSVGRSGRSGRCLPRRIVPPPVHRLAKVPQSHDARAAIPKKIGGLDVAMKASGCMQFPQRLTTTIDHHPPPVTHTHMS